MRFRVLPHSPTSAVIAAWLAFLLIASAAALVFAFRSDASETELVAVHRSPLALSRAAPGTGRDVQVGTTLLPLAVRLRPVEE
jgi:hypothetical protein